MSQDSETGSCVTSSSSPSLLNNLRQFRFHKKSINKIESVNSTVNGIALGSPIKSSPDLIVCRNESAIPIIDSPIKSSPDLIVCHKKFAGRILDSDCEDTSIVNNLDSENSLPRVSNKHIMCRPLIDSDSEDVSNEIESKESKLKFIEDAFPAHDKMVLQDALMNANWSVEEAMANICEDTRPVINTAKKRSIDSPPHESSKVRRKMCNMEGDHDEEVDDEESGYQDDRVFNSDDSDQEICDELTEKKQQVFNFLSTATANELRLMPGTSVKKVEAIIAARPFTGWRELVKKFKVSKFLGPDLLNSAQEVVYTRQVVQTLMVKCVKLATQMEQAVAAGCSSVKKQPSLLADGLRLTGYQLVGLNWLLVMHNQDLNGILADEMGLGKTVQIIAFLAYLHENDLVEGPHLIVVPSSTLENWSNEFARWCPTLRVVKYYGSQGDRQMMRYTWMREGFEDLDVILTTYNIMNSVPQERKMFRVLPLQYVVLDEAHLLKNMSTQRYERLMRINAKHRVLLTGTPFQNNLLELMSLLIFVMPHMFAGKKKYLKQLFSKYPKQGLGMKEDDVPEFERQQVAQARRIMKPFVLRRLKQDVLKDLPTKTERTDLCALTSVQQERYNNLIKAFTKETKEQGGEGGEALSGMAMVMQLRRIANHPALLRYHYTEKQIAKMAQYLAADPFYKETRANCIQEDLSLMSDYELHQLAHNYTSLSGFYLPEDAIMESGKFHQLDSLLQDFNRNGDRVLIFSQFVIMLDILEAFLNKRGYKFLRLDGSTPVPSRQEMIDLYNRDSSILVFLLTTRAGGQGINLTAANTVIIHDIDFNPYNDKQAEDRSHRVGQTRSVTVIRLISKETIEEGMLKIAQEKLKLGKEISNTDENELMETKNIASLLKQTLELELSKTMASPLKST